MRISDWSSDVCSSDLEAEVAEEGRRVVTGRVLPDRRVDADGEGDDVGEQRGRQRQDGGEPEAVADDVGYRQLELEGIAEVALQQAEQPQPVLLDHRLVEADRKSTRLNSSHYCAYRMTYLALKNKHKL